jgi:hypothetical protein
MKSAFTLLTSSILLNLSAPPVATPTYPEKTRFLSANEETLRNCCEKMEKDRRRIFYLNTRKGRMNFQVKGIYTHEETIFFLLLLRNHSYIDFDVDSIRFYEADRWGKSPITTPLHSPVHSPIKVLRAVYTFGNTKLIRGKSEELSVIALPRFTLPEGKRLVIEVTEKNGGRNLHLFADNFTLLRARLI